MTHFKTLNSALLASALLAGCAQTGTSERDLNDDPPLADLDALLSGTPKADELDREQFKSDGILPTLFTELRDVQSAVKSQGRRGVCSVFSTAGYMEHLYIAAGHDEPDFSEQYLQWSVKFEVNSFPSSSGSNANYNLQSINNFGLVEETVWPYEINQWDETNDEACDGEDEQPTRCYTNGHPTDEMKAAPKYRLPRGRWLHPLDIKGHLMNRKIGAVVGLTFFYQSWNHRKSPLVTNDANWDLGIVLAPNDEDRDASLEDDLRAGHSIVIIGWDDDKEVQRVDGEGNLLFNDDGTPNMEKGFYLFKNSWGTEGFGINNEHGAGYGWLSMEYIHEFGRVRISDLPRPEDLPELPVVNPDELAFSSTDAVAIPDNEAIGIESSIEVETEEAVQVGSLTVDVDIDHSYKGDLIVSLRKGDIIVNLHDRSGGGGNDLKASFEVREFDGDMAAGTWRLSVSDHAGVDVGTLNQWTLRVTPQ